ncbi:MAG: helix-turn-helix transcriptional regulator [Solirubrobacteraceae bacterium]
MRGDEAAAGNRGPGMQSTRSRILAVLKRRGSCTVDEIAQQVALAPMTVRHHLMALERDDLVICGEERGRAGRPHHVYSLSPHGESRFRRHDNHLAQQIVRVVGTLDGADLAGLSPDEKTDLLFERLADRLVSQHGARLQQLALPQRVIAVTELLHEESGFAEWLAADGGWEIRDYNCCYRDLNSSEDGACPWHRRLLAGLLGPGAQPAPDALAAVHACRFVVNGDAASRSARRPSEPEAWRAH